MRKLAAANKMMKPSKLSGAKVSEAPDFLVLVDAASPVGVPVRAPVPVTRLEPFTVPVLFPWKKTWGELSAVAVEVVVLTELELREAVELHVELEYETTVELAA